MASGPAMIDVTSPFVLLDDARAEGAQAARLYRRPIEIVETRDPDRLKEMLERLRGARRRGLHAAGSLSYEGGYALERKLAPLRAPAPPEAPPLLWFGLFEGYEELVDVGAALPDPASAWLSAPQPLIERRSYEAAVGRIKAHIEAGDIYQANLTFAALVRTAGSPLGLYASVRARAQAGHGGLVFTGDHWLLSFSPELFFTVEGGRITTRPMKGTAVRAGDDDSAVAALKADPKQRAENLMIVDLLRNDLSKVSRPGTVKVPSLFEVETYPTVHQMTSTVTAELQEGVDGVGVIEAIFPCGSITGAPKIRAMEILGEIEDHRRGAYTGSIGSLSPNGDAAFNVAIRTLVMQPGSAHAVLGLGSGIVADSEAGEEWRECLAKGAFVADRRKPLDLIETMRFDPHDGVLELERHLARMKASAQELGFDFDRHAARNDLQAATFRLREPRRIRLLVSREGMVALEGRAIPHPLPEPVEVAVAPLPVPSDDFRLRHKTTDRSFYDEARARSGRAEVLFEDKDGFLTEGSFTHIFVERGGHLLTPALSRGLLPGILRARLIEQGEAEEADLTPTDLASGFYIGNVVRGLMRAVLCQ
ncbi:MAG TPA: aminodeoxychorismate synthase component I [Allosphingosinicella sp.]|jgi:para-aminobenzoate synthetase/4-amino-4-deoxychorismate lyase